MQRQLQRATKQIKLFALPISICALVHTKDHLNALLIQPKSIRSNLSDCECIFSSSIWCSLLDSTWAWYSISTTTCSPPPTQTSVDVSKLLGLLSCKSLVELPPEFTLLPCPSFVRSAICPLYLGVWVRVGTVRPIFPKTEVSRFYGREEKDRSSTSSRILNYIGSRSRGVIVVYTQHFLLGRWAIWSIQK